MVVHVVVKMFVLQTGFPTNGDAKHDKPINTHSGKICTHYGRIGAYYRRLPS